MLICSDGRSPGEDLTNDLYVKILNQLFQGLGENRASLWVDPRPKPYSFYFELAPKNEKAAPISATVDNEGDIDITIGSVTTAIESNRDYNSPEQLERFRAICEAVVAGRYEEVLYSCGATRLGVVGIVHLPDRDLKFKTIYRLNLKWLSPHTHAARTTFVPY